MRTNEDRIALMHARAGVIERKRRSFHAKIYRTASVAACFVFIVLLAVMIPNMTPELASGTYAGTASASIFTDNDFLGYVVIGIVAFLLGGAVTVFCFKLKKWQEENNNG